MTNELAAALASAQVRIESGLGAGPACFTCSFQVEDVVVLDLLRERAGGIPVLFLETGYHFADVLALRDLLAARWRLNVINLLPQQTRAQQEAARGLLYQHDAAACCQARKVATLMPALGSYRVWFTGLRREQSPTRANLQPEERQVLASGQRILKISPLAEWTWPQVWQYTLERKLPYLPLYDQGYRSVGCAPCTAPVADGAAARSGRWGGAKLECGIHALPATAPGDAAQTES